VVSCVPTLEGSVWVTDPQSIIAYTLRRYCRTPMNTMPFLSDMIISINQQIALYGREPDNLVARIQSDLQNVYNRIFGDEREVSVTATYANKVADNTYDITIAVMYTTTSGELSQTGGTILLVDGMLKIPEDTIMFRVSDDS
jgi:hypothetical protein